MHVMAAALRPQGRTNGEIVILPNGGAFHSQPGCVVVDLRDAAVKIGPDLPQAGQRIADSLNEVGLV